MKKYIITFTLLIAIALTACAQQKKTGRRKTPAAKSSVTSIQMSRGACFGRCPTYTLSIDNNGKANYQGKMFTDFKGVYEKQYTPAQVAGLFKEFSKYRMDTCGNEYRVVIADLPGLDYTLVINGEQKTINNAGFGPHFMIQLSELVDKTVKVDKTWKKVADLAE